MEEVVASQTIGQKAPNTWFRGKDPIDGIWITKDIEVIRASYLPFDADAGDHRPVVVDLTMGSVLGQSEIAKSSKIGFRSLFFYKITAFLEKSDLSSPAHRRLFLTSSPYF